MSDDSKKLKPCQRAGLVTAVFTAGSSVLFQFGGPLREFGWDVLQWFTAWGETGVRPDESPFADLSVVARVGSSLAAGVVAGGANWMWRCAQTRFPKIPGIRVEYSTPLPPPAPGTRVEG